MKNPKNKIADNSLKLLKNLKSEPSLCLDGNVLAEIDGDNDIIACGAYIKIKKAPLNSLVSVDVDINHLMELYSSVAENIWSSKPGNLLGLKIVFGTDRKGLHFTYKPICMNLRGAGRDGRSQKQGIFETNEEGGYLEYDSKTGFIKESATVPPYLADYKKDVEILHTKTEGFSGFIEGEDAETVMFSFQEIFALLYFNKSDKLKIFNCVRRITKNDSFIKRHSVVLASENTGPLFLDGKFESNYANLGHLCPPNCPIFVYQLE